MTTARPPLPVSAGPRLRRAVRIGGSLLTIGTLAVALLGALNSIAYEDFSVETAYSATELAGVDTVRLQNSAGHSEVRGHDGGDALVTTRGTDGIFGADHGNEVSSGALRIDGSCSVGIATRCRVDHTVAVPDDLAVEVRARFGDVWVSGIGGPVDVDAQFGRVDLSDLSGPVDVRHRFGVVDARGITAATVELSHEFGQTTLVFAEAPTEVRVDSRFGLTVVEVPDDGTTYRVTGTHEFGDRTVEVRTDPASDQVIHVDHEFGDVIIRYAR